MSCAGSGRCAPSLRAARTQGKRATLENVLRVARALGVLDVIAEALDPYNSDVGRMRADELLPIRVRKSSRS